jgi:hypothetical protein
MRLRVKKHTLQAAFLHGLFGNRYTKDGLVSALAPELQEFSAIQINLFDPEITPDESSMTAIFASQPSSAQPSSRPKQTGGRIHT